MYSAQEQKGSHRGVADIKLQLVQHKNTGGKTSSEVSQ